MKLLGSTEVKITKDKNVENIPHIEIIEVILVHCNVVIMIINKIQEFCIHSLQTNHMAVY